MAIHVLKPGLLTTIQDIGRFGYQKYGVIASGAMDSFACQAANILVGNNKAEAVFEMTVIGAHFLFDQEAVIAICGGQLNATVDGIDVPMWRPVYIEAGTILKFNSSSHGCRAYLAVAGGISIVQKMNSYATYLRAEIGGYSGRALKAEDRIEIKHQNSKTKHILNSLKKTKANTPFKSANWHVSSTIVPAYINNPEIRIVAAQQYKLFKNESLLDLVELPFNVQSQSDRMGYRLHGKPLQMIDKKEMISEPVTFGTIQVPPDGQPIVLMADRQTTGGYPKIAQVISADLPLIAQAQTGAEIRFKQVDLYEAQEERLKMDLNLVYMQNSVHMKFM